MRAFALLTLAALVVLLPREAAAQDAAATGEARARFQAGVSFYDQGFYESARDAFRQAYALHRHPTILLNLGQACLRSGRSVEAVRAFEQFLADATGASDSQRADARAGIAEAKGQFAHVEVTAGAGFDVLIDGELVGTTPLSIPVAVEAGAHAVQVRKGDVSDTQSIAPEQGQTIALRFTVGPRPGPAAPQAPVTEPRPAAPPSPPAPAVEAPAPPPPPVVAPVSANPSESDLPNLPVHDAPPQSTMDLWPAYLGYALMAPAVAASLYVGFKSVSDARTNASVTSSNVTRAGGSCPTADPQFAASCSNVANDQKLVNTDKTVAYSLAAGSGVLFAVSTIYLAVAFSHNARHEEPEPARQQGGVTVVPVVQPQGAGVAVYGAF